MNQEEIVEVLIDKFTLDHANYRIGLNGKWGIGKSFVWELFKNRIEKKANSDKGLKVIYCSLFGIENIESLKKELKRKKLELDDRFGKISKSKHMNLIKMAGNIVSNKFLGGTIDVLELVSLEFDNGYMVCFDDLERTSANVEISDVMGVIEQVAQTTSVLVIYNEQELRDKTKDFQRQKEKILEIVYTLDSLSSDIIKQLIRKTVSLEEEELETLIKFFLEHGKNNLRTLKKLTSFINQLKRKVPLNAELINLSAAVFIEEILNTDKEKELSDEEKSKLEFNPLIVYQKYNINYRAFSLLEQIKNFIVANKIDKTLFESYITPAEKSTIVMLMDQFYEGILVDKKTIQEIIVKSIDVLKNASLSGLQEDYIILLVADMKYFDRLFNLKLLPLNLESIALSRIKSLIDQTEIHTDIRRKRFASTYYRMSIRNEVLPLVQNILSQAKEYREHHIQQSITNEFEKNFTQEKYDECESILVKNIDVLGNHLYIFNKLAQPCSQDYFNFIRNILEITTINNSIKKLVRRRLFDLKRKQKDDVAVHRIKLVLSEFLRRAYDKAHKVNY